MKIEKEGGDHVHHIPYRKYNIGQMAWKSGQIKAVQKILFFFKEEMWSSSFEILLEEN